MRLFSPLKSAPHLEISFFHYTINPNHIFQRYQPCFQRFDPRLSAFEAEVYVPVARSTNLRNSDILIKLGSEKPSFLGESVLYSWLGLGHLYFFL
jgi:hypothetical protein